MSERKPKIKEKASDVRHRQESETSIKVNMMLLLIREFPEKAREAVKKLTRQTI